MTSADAAGEGDELFKGADEGSGRAAGLADDGFGQRLLAGAGVDQHAAAAVDQALGHRGISLGWPAFGAPAGAGVDEYGGLLAAGGQNLVGPGLGGGVDRQPGLHGVELVAGDGRGQLDILLDDVRALGGHALGKQPAGGTLARFGLADAPPAAGSRAITAERMAPCRSSTAS